MFVLTTIEMAILSFVDAKVKHSPKPSYTCRKTIKHALSEIKHTLAKS